MAIPVWSAVISVFVIAVASQESYSTSRLERSVIIPNKLISSRIDFTTANVRRLFYPPAATKDVKELKSNLNLIENDLKAIEKTTETIKTELRAKNLNSVVSSYLERESKIKDGLKSFRKYLDNPNDKRVEREFNDRFAELPMVLLSLLDCRVTQNEADQINIVTSLRKAVHCHGRKLHEKAKITMGIFMAGLWLHIEYRRMKNPCDDQTSLAFEASIIAASGKWLKLLEREVFKCRMDETRVPEEMRDVILNISNNKLNQTTAADDLLRFLSDKYDTKHWIVMVSLKSNQEIIEEITRVDFKGFHKVNERGLIVGAISVDRSTSFEFNKLYQKYLKDSKRTEEDRIYNPNDFKKTVEEMANNYDKNFLYIRVSCVDLKYIKKNSPEFTVIATWTEVEDFLFTDCNDEKQMRAIEPIPSVTSPHANYFVYLVSDDSPLNEEIHYLRNQSYFHTGNDDEQRVTNQITIEEDIKQQMIDNDRMGLADAVVNLLEKKYGDKKWMVLVVSEEEPQSKQKVKQFLNEVSEFYTVSSKGSFVAAVSIRNAEEEILNKMAKLFRMDFLLITDSCKSKMSDINIIVTSTTGREQILFSSDYKCVDQVKSRVTLKNIRFNPDMNDDYYYRCQRGVEDEMRQVIVNQPDDNRSIGVAHLILKVLEDKYSDKKWLILVISDYEAQARGKMERVLSGGFYTVSAQGYFAAAVSIDGDAIVPITNHKFKHRAENYQFPIETVDKMKHRPELGYDWKYLDKAEDVYQNFNRYLSPLWMWTKELMEIESVVITTPCGNHGRIDILDYMTFAASKDGLTWAVAMDNDVCSDRLVAAVLVPKGTRHLSPRSILTNCYLFERWRLPLSRVLRNEFTQGYLSAAQDHPETLITVDNNWRNSIGQRWQFYHFLVYDLYDVTQLRNDNGKCLTAKNRNSRQLYQQECHKGYVAGQVWQQRGLQIVNGFELCLTLEESDNGITYAVQARCDSTPPFLWYNWATYCEDVIVNHASMTKNNTYLRNDFSRRFLSASKDAGDERAKNEPWTNQPGQNWKFINETLVNGYGKCLTVIKDNFVRQEDCVKNRKEQKWTRDYKLKQVIGTHGKCLSAGDKSGYVTYDNCSDNNSKQRWNH